MGTRAKKQSPLTKPEDVLYNSFCLRNSEQKTLRD